MKRIFAYVLVLALLLCGCAGNQQETQPATEPAPTAAMTEAELTAMLQGGGRISLGADLELTGEILINGKILDGGNKTVTGPAPQEGVVETENALTVEGGTVENITIIGKYRAIGDRKGAGANSDVRLKNITVDGGESYCLNFGYGNGNAGLYVENSKLCGWSSYTKFRQAQFTNCTFAWSANGEQGGLRPYIDTTLVGCKFEGKTNADGTVSPFGLTFKSSIEGVTLILEDCYVGDTLITQENIHELLNVQAFSNIIRVQNSNG